MATVRNMGWCSVLGVIPPGGLYIDGLHSQNPQRYQGPYSDFKKVGTLFFRSSIRIPMFEGLTTVFNTHPTQGFADY